MNANQNPAPVNAKQLLKQRWELIILFAMPIVGTLLMTAYYYAVVDASGDLGTHNKGELIAPPKPVAELELVGVDGKAFKLDDGTGTWSFVVVPDYSIGDGEAQCDEACQKNLYLTRQIREALGKYKMRVRNVLLSQSPTLAADFNQLMSTEYQGHTVTVVDSAAFDQWSKKEEPALDSLPSVSFYVVDPAGWLMMYYSSEHNYKQVISDMKFLIKNS